MTSAVATIGDNWSARARYIADLVDADAVVVAIAGNDSEYTRYASHNLPPGVWDVGPIARAIRTPEVTVAAVATPLTDQRMASDLCAAPLVWERRVIGSLAALRVGRPWESTGQRTLARSADLVALELAEEYARLWWQRAAEAWQRRIQLLEQTRRELSNATDAVTLVDLAAKRIANVFGADGASLMLLDGTGQLVVRSAFGPHQERAKTARRQVGEGISGWVAQHGQPLLLRGRVEDSRFSGVDPTIEESLIVPLRLGGRVLGVVATRTSRSTDNRATERLRDLDLIAGEISLLVARAEEEAARIDITTRLENDRREAVAMFDLARLAGIGADPDGDLEGATRLIAEVFHHDIVAIWTVDDARARLVRRSAFGYGEILPGDLELGRADAIDRVLVEGQARLLNDVPADSWLSVRARSLILAPIAVGGESAGLLLLGRREARYEDFDFSLATTMTDLLSSLVQREISAQRAARSEEEQRVAIERIRGSFAEELGRVVYVLDACQRLLGQDRDLPGDLARAARDARSAVGRLGLPTVAPQRQPGPELAPVAAESPALEAKAKTLP